MSWFTNVMVIRSTPPHPPALRRPHLPEITNLFRKMTEDTSTCNYSVQTPHRLNSIVRNDSRQWSFFFFFFFFYKCVEAIKNNNVVQIRGIMRSCSGLHFHDNNMTTWTVTRFTRFYAKSNVIRICTVTAPAWPISAQKEPNTLFHLLTVV